MQEYEKPKNRELINGYIEPSQVFILDNGKFKDYIVELIDSVDLGYIIRGVGNYPYTKDEYKCYNDFDIFFSVYKLGKELTDILYDVLLEQNRGKNIYVNAILTNTCFVLNLSPKDVKRIEPFINNWSRENGVLFRSEREYIEDLYNYTFTELSIFIDRCISIYTIYSYIEIEKKRQHFGDLTDTEKNELDKLSKLINANIDVNELIDDLFVAIRFIETHSPEIYVQDRLVSFINGENKLKYRSVKYYSNILSAAWYKMKLLICEDLENSHFRTCRRCNNPYEVTSNNQKYCIHCGQIMSRKKYSRRYWKILKLHQDLIELYNQAKVRDVEIEKMINLKLKEDIYRLGVDNLENAIKKVKKLQSL